MPRPTTTSVDTGIDASELKALKANIKALKPDSPEWNKRFSDAYKRAGEVIVAEARRQASAMGGVQARAVDAISASGATAGVTVRIANKAKVPFGLAAFWGADAHTGWYARGRYSNSPRQHSPWVGAGWAVGAVGEGPYAINSAIAAKLDEAMRLWAEEIESIMADIPTT